MRKVLALYLGATALLVVLVTPTFASPASGVAPTVLSRGTFDRFKVMSNPDNGGLVKLETKSDTEVWVRQHVYQPGGSTGWHAHPYPVLITVVEGELMFYRYDDPTCTPVKVKAGEGYVDDGRGHLGRNEGAVRAVDVSVILSPVAAPFRSELDAPAPACEF